MSIKKRKKKQLFMLENNTENSAVIAGIYVCVCKTKRGESVHPKGGGEGDVSYINTIAVSRYH